MSGRFIGSGRPEFGQGSASAMSMKWSALHDAAGAVAMIAALDPPRMTAAIRNFPVTMREADSGRLKLAEQGIEDISAIMEPGLSALLAAHARGADSRHAARALWDEFVRARDAVLSLAPTEEERGTLRFA